MSKLKDCPFCGGEANFKCSMRDYRIGGVHIECSKECVKTGVTNFFNDASKELVMRRLAKLWNRRAELNALQQEKDNLAKEVAHWSEAEKDGRLIVLDKKTALAMCAGAYAITQGKRLYGSTYNYDINNNDDSTRITFYEAAGIIRSIAEKALQERTKSE